MFKALLADRQMSVRCFCLLFAAGASANSAVRPAAILMVLSASTSSLYASGLLRIRRLVADDGGALVFRTSPEAPERCAVEISKELKRHPELQVRMGIHSGPVNEITDLNEQANIAGAGINIAQRVMNCGDAGHILLSQHVADDLEQYPQWGPLLHDLGECEVKRARGRF